MDRKTWILCATCLVIDDNYFFPRVASPRNVTEVTALLHEFFRRWGRSPITPFIVPVPRATANSRGPIGRPDGRSSLSGDSGASLC